MPNIILPFLVKLLAAYLESRMGATQVPGLRTLYDKDIALLELKQKEGAVIVILGARGTGKTELAYRLAEFLGKPTYAVSPEQTPPKWIHRVSVENFAEEVPPNSTLIADDLPVYMSSRQYTQPFAKGMEKIIPMVRHERKLHLIFVSQSGSQADKYALDADAAFLKPGSIFLSDTERPGIKKVYDEINPIFEGKSEDWIRKHAFLIARRFKGMITVEKT